MPVNPKAVNRLFITILEIGKIVSSPKLVEKLDDKFMEEGTENEELQLESEGCKLECKLESEEKEVVVDPKVEAEAENVVDSLFITLFSFLFID